jgi:hypothetical protein
MSDRPLSDATLDQLLELNPALAQCNMRVDNETQKGSVFDVIALVSGKNSNDSNKVYQRLDLEFKSKCLKLRINGKGKRTPVADAPTLIEIIWELPGKAAKAFRRQSAHLVARYLGADRTLIDEIEARYERVPAAAQTFFQAHAERPEVLPLSDDEHQRVLKRKRDDLELAELDARVKELDASHKNRMEELDGARVLARTRLVSNPEIQRMMSSDAHIQSVFNDYLKQSMMSLAYEGNPGPATENKTHDFCPDFVALCVELGFGVPSRSKLITLGKLAARAFREVQGKEPETTIKYVNGANRTVKTYRIEHLDWLKGIVRETMGATA